MVDTLNKFEKDQLSEYISELFGEIQERTLEDILEHNELLTLDTGGVLFDEGDQAKSLFILLRGRLRVVKSANSESQIVLGDINAGEPVGEMALFTDNARMATVFALRKSLVLKITKTNYLQLVSKFPVLSTNLARFVMERVASNTQLSKKKKKPPKNIAVLNFATHYDKSHWVSQIDEQLAVIGMNANIYDHEAATFEQISVNFDEVERKRGLNFFICAEELNEWSEAALTYCDIIIIAVDFKDSHHIRPIEKQLELYSKNLLNKDVFLIMLHKSEDGEPVNTERWFHERNISYYFHLREQNDRDVRKFCRVITNQAIGLVLGGGGAKGAAHWGVIQALIEEGLEFDFVGGTSAGALYGAIAANCDFNFSEIQKVADASAKVNPTKGDYTIPFLSMMSGKKIKKILINAFGQKKMEDLWINFYTLSANYSTGKPEIHEKGFISDKVAASIAVPGLLPPKIINNEIHIDGGVFDNVPITHMLSKPVGQIVAVSLQVKFVYKTNINNIPSAWQLVRSKFSKTKKYKIPSLASLLINSLTINSAFRQDEMREKVSLFLELDLRYVNFLDWENWREIWQEGYVQAKQFLSQLPEKDKFWKYNSNIP